MRNIFFGFLILMVSSTIVAGADEDPPPPAFSLCANCHTIMAEGQQAKAPPLKGILGREIASVPEFDYSDGLKAMAGIWTKDLLDEFLKRPNHAVADTKMYFRGLQDAAARAKLIKWLSEADVPTIMPPRTERRSKNAAIIVNKKDELFRSCKTCHNYTKGAPAKVGPNLYGVVGREIASFPDFSYSTRLKTRGGVWTTKELHKFFTEKKTFGQGSHLAFRGLKEKEDRDLLIKFLTSLSAKE